jgi:hypothetical protein
MVVSVQIVLLCPVWASRNSETKLLFLIVLFHHSCWLGQGLVFPLPHL